MASLALVTGTRDSWKYVRDRSTRIQASEGIKGLPNLIKEDFVDGHMVTGTRDSRKYVRDRSTRIRASEGIEGLPN